MSLKNIILIFAMMANSILVIAAPNSAKFYQDAGICFGMVAGGKLKGMNPTQLSPNAIKNYQRLGDDVGDKVDKWNSQTDACYRGGGTIPQIKECIDKKIPDNSAAEFWKGYVSGKEYTFRQNALQALHDSNQVCITVY